MLLQEWFADRRLYHLVGYLIWLGEDVTTLCTSAIRVGKREFRKTSKRKSFSTLLGRPNQFRSQ